MGGIILRIKKKGKRYPVPRMENLYRDVGVTVCRENNLELGTRNLEPGTPAAGWRLEARGWIGSIQLRITN